MECGDVSPLWLTAIDQPAATGESQFLILPKRRHAAALQDPPAEYQPRLAFSRSASQYSRRQMLAEEDMMELKSVRIQKPADVNLILGQAHFIKTVEDLFETLVAAVPGIQFGLAFCESSGACLVRSQGTDEEMRKLAADNALAIGAGHSFIIFLRNAYPINVLKAVQGVQEVCNIYCATANQVDVVLAESSQGRGILGVVDGEKPKGIEDDSGIAWRKNLLRTIGYKIS